MIRNILIYFILFFPVSVFSQHESLLLHFNNADDRVAMEKTVRDLVKIDQFITTAHQTDNGDVQIQLLFFDPSLVGVLESDNISEITTEAYLQKWYELYDDINKRIVLFFVKASGEYKYVSLTTTKMVKEGQLPEIVLSFIVQQIVKNGKDFKETITLAMNAIKNAFDQRFLNNLVDNAATLFPDNQYYKGYSCIDFDYYFIERVENSNKQQHGCAPVFYRGSDYNFNYVYPKAPPFIEAPTSSQSYIMDFYAAKESIYKRWNFSINNYEDVLLKKEDEMSLFFQESSEGDYKGVLGINYTYDYFDFSSPATTYKGINDGNMPAGLKRRVDIIYWNPNQFKEWRFNGAIGSPLSFEDKIQACTGTHRVKVFNGRIKTRIDHVDERHGISTWGMSNAFRNAQPTWCNVFARVLSRKVFGQDAFPAKSCSGLYGEEFSVKKSEYVEITVKDDPDYIWDLINKGFPIYFISDAHIETGFPDGYAFSSYRHRYENDSRYVQGNYSSYLDSNALNQASGSKNHLVVGAGNSVGFKLPWENYEWLRKSAKVYLYLGYLKNIYK